MGGRPPLSIAVAQPACIPYDVEANARAHAEAVHRAAARLVVFPELSLTGYELGAPAVDPDDPRLGPIVAACAAGDSLALVGAPVRDEPSRRRPGSEHIAMLAIEGGGSRVAYRKMWLGEAEAQRFAPGPAPAVLDIDGWRLGLAICKDTGTAQHLSDTVGLGIDAYVAGTVKCADEAELQHDRARRIGVDHNIWVAVASMAGSTGGGYVDTAGRSAIWAPGGALVAAAGSDVGASARAMLT
jgi:predicted amidohydrolase